jgi:uncharacterized protein (DUF1778 family)
MPKQTTRVSLRLTPEAEAALDRLAPSVNKRGAYVSQLILQAAQVEPPAEALYAALGRRLVALAEEVQYAVVHGEPPGGRNG